MTMSDIYPPVPPQDENLPRPVGQDTAPGIDTQTPTGEGQGTTQTAKEQASQLGSTTSEASQNVAETAKDEASKVASETKNQAKDVFREAQGQLSEQAGEQQKKVASGLRSISDELKSMANNSEGDGMATDLVHQAASRAGSVASWLDDRDPGALLDDVRRFAQQRPGAFIGIAAAAGILAGRLTRSLASGDSDGHETHGSHASGQRRGEDSRATAGTGSTDPRAVTSSPVYDATLGATQDTSDFSSSGLPPTEPGTTSMGQGQL